MKLSEEEYRIIFKTFSQLKWDNINVTLHPDVQLESILFARGNIVLRFPINELMIFGTKTIFRMFEQLDK